METASCDTTDKVLNILLVSVSNNKEVNSDSALYLGHPITNFFDVSHKEQFSVQRAGNETQP